MGSELSADGKSAAGLVNAHEDPAAAALRRKNKLKQKRFMSIRRKKRKSKYMSLKSPLLDQFFEESLQAPMCPACEALKFSPESKAGLLSRLTFWFIQPMMTKGLRFCCCARDDVMLLAGHEQSGLRYDDILPANRVESSEYVVRFSLLCWLLAFDTMLLQDNVFQRAWDNEQSKDTILLSRAMYNAFGRTFLACVTMSWRNWT